MKTLREISLTSNIKEVVLADRLRQLLKEGKEGLAEKRQINDFSYYAWFVTKKGEEALLSEDWNKRRAREYQEKIKNGTIHSFRKKGQETNFHFKIRLALACKIHNLLLKDLSEGTGIPVWVFQSIDRDRRTFITKEELERVCEFFNVDEKWFLETSTIIDFTKVMYTE